MDTKTMTLYWVYPATAPMSKEKPFWMPAK